MDYEKKLAELENLVKQLEEGGLTKAFRFLKKACR